MTEALYSAPENPGSLKDFAAAQGSELSDGQVTYEYTAVLARYRTELAKARGISLEELHEGPLRTVGRVASEGFTAEGSSPEAA